MNKIKKIVSLAVAICIVGAGMVSQVGAEEKAKMSLSRKSITIKEGKSFTISSKGEGDVKVSFSDKGSDRKIGVTSKDSKKVMIKKVSDTTYKVKGIKAGGAVIQVKYGKDDSLRETITVKVTKKAKKKPGLRTLIFKDFEKEVVKAKGRVAIMFGTDWCHYCQLLDPIYKKAAEKDGKVKYFRVDAEKEEELSALFGITAYPYVYLLENDKTIDVTGYIRDWSEEDYIKWANEKKVQK